MDAQTLIAFGTLLLVAVGLATVVLAIRGDWQRRGDAFRAVLVDLSDQCRIWATTDPTANPQRAGYLAEHLPQRDAVDSFLGKVTPSAPVLQRLQWEMAQARSEAEATLAKIAEAHAPGEEWAMYYRQLAAHNREPVPHTEGYARAISEAGTHRALTLDHLQVVACLIRTAAARQRFSGVGHAFDDVAWFAPRGRLKRPGNEVQWYPLIGAPPFPTDPAYAECSPEAREAEAEKHAKAEEERLRGATLAPPGNP